MNFIWLLVIIAGFAIAGGVLSSLFTLFMVAWDFESGMEVLVIPITGGIVSAFIGLYVGGRWLGIW